MNWQEFFDNEKKLPYFNDLLSFINDEYKSKIIYPPKELIFNAFRLTPFENVKVIIIGQDPYFNKGQAMGLAFSVPENEKLPPSLINIYKEIGNEFEIEIKQNGDLTYLAIQGVLLLNTTLTVEEKKPLSHAGKGYEVLIRHVLEKLDLDNSPKVFILWGNNAKKFKSILYNKRHLILESAHPSPLGAHKGFFGNNHFIKTNDFLIQNGLLPIKWNNE